MPINWDGIQIEHACKGQRCSYCEQRLDNIASLQMHNTDRTEVRRICQDCLIEIFDKIVIDSIKKKAKK